MLKVSGRESRCTCHCDPQSQWIMLLDAIGLQVQVDYRLRTCHGGWYAPPKRLLQPAGSPKKLQSVLKELLTPGSGLSSRHFGRGFVKRTE